MKDLSTEEIRGELRRRNAEDHAEFLARHSDVGADDLVTGRQKPGIAAREALEKLQALLEEAENRRDAESQKVHKIERQMERAKEARNALYNWQQ